MTGRNPRMSSALPITRSRFRTLISITSLAALLAVSGCATETEEQEPTPSPTTTTEPAPEETTPDAEEETSEAAAELKQQGVAAAQLDAGEAGMQVLEVGGNAVDAAIATPLPIGVGELD